MDLAKARKELNDEMSALRHAQIEQEEVSGKKPNYLREEAKSVGLIGRSGVGKSSLWNTLVRYLFRRYVPEDSWPGYIGGIPKAKVGPVETTREAAAYQIPESALTLVDHPGHGTVAFDTTAYAVAFGLKYFDRLLYVYSGRLLQSDVNVMINLLMHQVHFAIVRQKFHQDIDSFSCREEAQGNIFDDDEDSAVSGAEVCQEATGFHKVETEVLVQYTRFRLANEVQSNMNEALFKLKHIPSRRHIRFFCVDSKFPEQYDGPALRSYISATTGTEFPQTYRALQKIRLL